MILTCPSAPNVSSTIAQLPAAQYVLCGTSIGNAAMGFSEPWVVSPVLPNDYWNTSEGPHAGGFNVATCDPTNSESGAVTFIARQGP